MTPDQVAERQQLDRCIWRHYRERTLTRAFRDVMLTACRFRGPGGVAWPSHATLAERAGCCVRTVQRALDAAKALGLVLWHHRHRREGWRRLRISNLYRFFAVAPPESTTRQKARAKRRESKKVADGWAGLRSEGLEQIAKRRMAALGLG